MPVTVQATFRRFSCSVDELAGAGLRVVVVGVVAGSIAGAASPLRCAAIAAARYAGVGWRPRSRSVARTLSTRSTYRHPPSLLEPKLFLRQITAGRSIRSARLLVGSSPGVAANRHSAGSRLSSERHKPAVFF